MLRFELKLLRFAFEESTELNEGASAWIESPTRERQNATTRVKIILSIQFTTPQQNRK